MTDRTTPNKVVFFGSPEFAVPSFRALHQDPRFELALVVTQPDRRAGRGKTLHPPALKVTAEDLGMRVTQPASLSDGETLEAICSTGADLFIVVAYGEKLGRRLLEAPRFGCVNVHPSLLPRYRGSSPVPAAILNGDAKTGVSIIKLTRRLDAGPIVSQSEVELHGNEDGGQLGNELSQVAAMVLPDVAAGWCRGAIIPITQNHAEANYTTELSKADGQIDWRDSAERIERQCRAMSPWPGCWTEIEGRRLAISQVEVRPSAEATFDESRVDRSPGTLVAPGSSTTTRAYTSPGIITGDGVVRLLRVTPEGKREMSGADWWRGNRLEPGARAELVDRRDE